MVASTGSGDQFPSDLSSEKSSTFNHQTQRPPHPRHQLASWESQLQSLLGLLWEPDPFQRPVGACHRRVRACDRERHRCDPLSKKQSLPAFPFGARGSERQNNLSGVTQHARNQYVGPGAAPRTFWFRGLLPQGVSVPHCSPAPRTLAPSSRTWFMNERTRVGSPAVRALQAAVGRRHLPLFLLCCYSGNQSDKPGVTAPRRGGGEAPGPRFAARTQPGTGVGAAQSD